MPQRLVSCLLVIVLAAALGCAGSAWRTARQEDTAAGYADFLRAHPSSSYAEEARARSALVRVRNHPTPAGYEAFRKSFPDSPLLGELRTAVEEVFFERARAAGTVDAYREYLAEFGGGRFADRAEGNAVYLEARGFGGQPDALEDFAAKHPQSDYAPEARRTAAAVKAHGGSGFTRVGLLMDVDPSTPGADRVARQYRELALRAYQNAGLELIPLQGERDRRAASLPALLRIQHREGQVRTRMDGTTMTTPGILAKTTLTLWKPGSDAPIWTRSFELRAETPALDGGSILFGAGTQAYWSSFFVPVATWSTEAAVRKPAALERVPVAIETAGGRAVLLYENGDLEILDLADPEQPVRVGEYRRPRDLSKWSGVRLIGSRAVIFGGDGIEVIELARGGAERVATRERSEVGTIHAVEGDARGLVTAGKRGLQLVPAKGAPQVLLDREILGLVKVGPRLVFSDGTSVFVATVDLLRQGRVEAELRLGTGFGPGRLRLVGDDLVVLGRRGVMRVDLSRPGAPRVESRIEMAEAGQVEDALEVGGRLFLLGERGLQVTDARGEHVLDSADVAARHRVAVSGRHLVMVGGSSLQVVDATPFVMTANAAASRAR